MSESVVNLNIVSAEYWGVHGIKHMVVIKYIALSDTVDCTIEFQ